MDNLSALKLFNSVLKADVTQNASASSSQQSSQSDETDGNNGFENIFQSYLDRSQDDSQTTQQSSGDTAQQTGQDSPAAQAQTTSTVTQDTSAQGLSQPEKPEDVIDSLNIPQDAKDALKKMLAGIDSKDDANNFLQQLMAMMQAANMTVSQVEKTLSDFATSILNQQIPSVNTQGPSKAYAMLLEKTLDQLVSMQTDKQDPQALFKLPGTDSGAKLTIINQQAQTQTAAQNKTPQTFTEMMQNAQAGKQAGAQTQTTGQTTAQTTAQTSGLAITAESGKAAAEAAPDTAVKIVAAVLTETQAKAGTQTTQEVSNVIELLAKSDDDSKTNSQQDNNAGSDFLARTPMTEKVITAEVKIEKPQDIMKFAELVEIAKNQGASKITVQLHPEDMGKVSIELTERAGKITGKVTFDNENARNLFASGADSLKQQLAEKGVTVENLEFLFKDFDQHQFTGWDKKQNNSGTSSGKDEQPEDEEQAQEETDNSVIYA